MSNDFVTSFIEVVPLRPYGDVWRLYYLHPCLSCGKRHYHGGGDGAVPELGSRGGHCSIAHRPWRPDCEPIRERGQATECRKTHVTTGIELVLAAADEAAAFAE